WVGNPVRRPFWDFDRDRLRPAALERYGLDPAVPVVGVFGGSLGSRIINEAIAGLVEAWQGPRFQLLHVVGERFFGEIPATVGGAAINTVTLPFETAMEDFYAASDLVVARSGGAVAELTAPPRPPSSSRAGSEPGAIRRRTADSWSEPAPPSWSPRTGSTHSRQCSAT